jgi:hypothetical protein
MWLLVHADHDQQMCRGYLPRYSTSFPPNRLNQPTKQTGALAPPRNIGISKHISHPFSRNDRTRRNRAVVPSSNFRTRQDSAKCCKPWNVRPSFMSTVWNTVFR